MKSFINKPTILKLSSTLIATALLVFGFQNCGAGFQSLSSVAENTSFSSNILRTATARVKIPIHSQTFDNGTVRYSITFKIGQSGPIEALLDTGSSGLRVYANQLSDSDYADSGTPTQNTYGQGVQFNGTLVNGRLKIGGINKPVDFALIQNLSCAASTPNCPVSGQTLDTYAIGGNGVDGMGYQAIMGIGLRGVDTPNPFAAMGINSWIVILPRPGESDTGSLILNPNDAEIANYQLLQLEQFSTGVGWFDNRLPGCLTNQDTGKDFCMNALLDTGAFNIQIKSQNSGAARKLAAGQGMYFRLNDGGDDLAAIEFTSGDQTGSAVAVVTSAAELINTGPFPFYSYSIYFSYANGLIGFQGR